MAGTTGLGDDALELINLLLGTAEGSELESKLAYSTRCRLEQPLVSCRAISSYPLLGELAGTLVLGVAEQLDHTLLIGSEAIIKRNGQHMSFSILN